MLDFEWARPFVDVAMSGGGQLALAIIITFVLVFVYEHLFGDD